MLRLEVTMWETWFVQIVRLSGRLVASVRDPIWHPVIQELRNFNQFVNAGGGGRAETRTDIPTVMAV